MEGNQLLMPQSRALIAAAAFAVVSIVIFLVVWYAPAFFNMKSVGGGEEDLSIEEKMAILQKIRESDPAALAIPHSEKVETLERVAASSANGRPEESDKIRVIQAVEASIQP